MLECNSMLALLSVLIQYSTNTNYQKRHLYKKMVARQNLFFKKTFEFFKSETFGLSESESEFWVGMCGPTQNEIIRDQGLYRDSRPSVSPQLTKRSFLIRSIMTWDSQYFDDCRDWKNKFQISIRSPYVSDRTCLILRQSSIHEQEIFWGKLIGCKIYFDRCQDTQYNGTQHNDTQHNDT